MTKEKMTIEEFEREDRGQGPTEEEKLLIYGPDESKQKLSIGLGTMIIGRLLFGKFSKK